MHVNYEVIRYARCSYFSCLNKNFNFVGYYN